MPKRIFISHSSIDSQIGEQLLDALIDLGISKEDVFYSSIFHTGVGLGKNINYEVKKAIIEAELIIFILTKNFYRSPYCLNEMGAVWAYDKPFIPILLDGLKYSDMKGFIDGNYIAIQPKATEMYKIFSFLKQNFQSIRNDVDVEKVFKGFVDIANTYISKNQIEYINPFAHLSDIEVMILENKFTEDEILMLSYFLENQTNKLIDIKCCNTTEYKEKEKILKHIELYGIPDYQIPLSLLEQSHFIDHDYDFIMGNIQDYAVFTLDINHFRDLLRLSEMGKTKIKNLKDKRRLIVDPPLDITSSTIKATEVNQVNTKTEIEDFILSSKITEIDALMLKYIIDTSTYIFGDRWKAEGQIRHIYMWEQENELEHRLSHHYDHALDKLKFKKYVNVFSETAYGNPREWILKSEIQEQLQTLSNAAKESLNKIYNRALLKLPF